MKIAKILFLLLFLSGANAQVLDFVWLDEFGSLPEANLRAVAPASDGFVGASGRPMRYLNAAGELECHHLMRYAEGRWSTTGVMPPVGEVCGLTTGSVRVVSAFLDDICIGGTFLNLGPAEHDYFSCYSESLGWYQPNGDGNGPNNEVLALDAIGGLLYVGGSFTEVDSATANPQLVNRIARTNGFSWEPLPDQGMISNGVSGSVRAILAAGNGFVYAGHGFGVSSWNPTIPEWKSLGSANDPNPVGDLEFSGPNLAATFTQFTTTVGGNPAGTISEYDFGDESWSAVAMSEGVRRGFGRLAIGNGALYATGDFTALDPDAKGLARLLLSGWSAAPDAADLGELNSGSIFDMAQSPDGQFCLLHQGGLPSPVFSQTFICHSGIGWVGTSNGLPTGFDGSNSGIDALTIYNGQLVAAGRFLTIGDQRINFLATWDGQRWQPFGEGLSATFVGGSVTAMAVVGNELYVSGRFDSAGGNPVPNSARWTGSQWQAIDPQLDAVVHLEWNQQLILSGFSNGGALRVLAYDGSTVSDVGNFPVNQSITALAVYQGDLIAAYRPLGSTNRTELVRFDGDQWLAFAESNNSVIEVLAVDGSDLYAAGAFSSISDGTTMVPASHIARWDGSQWHPLGEGVSDGGFFEGVDDVVIQGGAVIATGDFNRAGSTDDVRGIASWDGSSWSTLGHGLVRLRGSVSMVGSGLALAFNNDTLFVGGVFDQTGPTYASGIGSAQLVLEVMFTSGFE